MVQSAKAQPEAATGLDGASGEAPPQELGFAGVEREGSLIRQPHVWDRTEIDRGRVGRQIDEPLEHRTGQGRAIGFAGHGRHDGLRTLGLREIALPSAQEIHAPIGGAHRRAVAAIRDAVVEDPVRPGHVDGFGEGEGGAVFNHSAGVPRRELDVVDDAVVRVFRVDFAVEAAAEDFIGAGLAEELPAKRGRLALLNDYAGDSGVSAGHADQEGKGHASDRFLHSRYYLPIGVRGGA